MRLYENIFHPVIDEAGNINKFSVYIHDITDNKLTEQKSKESEEKYRLLFEESPIPYGVIDLSNVKSYIEGLNQIGLKDLQHYIDSVKPYDDNPLSQYKIIDINNATINLFENINKSNVMAEAHKFFNTQLLPLYKKFLTSIIAGASSYEEESKLTLFNGKELDVIWKFNIAPGCENSWSKILMSIIDITEQKKSVEQQDYISKTMMDAEKKKNEASQLIDSSARLASIGVIASGITHEINQPLNAIKMGSDGILFWNKTQKILPSMIVEMLEGISEASTRIEDIIKHMRAFWIDANASALEKVDLNKALDKALTLVSQKLFFSRNQFNYRKVNGRLLYYC